MKHEFALPISFREHNTLDDTLLTDLELLQAKPNSNDSVPIFQLIMNPSHSYEYDLSMDILRTYTTDVSFLTQTQTVVSNIIPHITLPDSKAIDQMYTLYTELESCEEFHTKYQYIEVKPLQRLNNSHHFLQMLSLYNMASPMITLLTPIVLMILPFFIIKLQGISLSLSAYIEALGKLFKNHAIGKLLTTFKDVSWDKRVYLLVTVAFYVMQIYQNANACYRFFTNMKTIHQDLFITREFIAHSIDAMDDFKERIYVEDLNTYHDFCSSFEPHLETLMKYRTTLEKITPLRPTFTKASQIGLIMQQFYALKHDTEFTSSILFSLRFNTYIANMKSISNLYQSKYIAKAHYKSRTSWKTKAMVYPPLYQTNSVSTSCDIKRSYVITGPNASGKTTLLKSAMINSILSQQFGLGFYENLQFRPYTHFHCYLDIPDTSGRDSLFQAEARRCLDIITTINQTSVDTTSNHLCIFDEIYSGTNPKEAVASAFSFIKYLSGHDNVRFLLTTHFHELCKFSKQLSNVCNYHLQVTEKYDEHGNDELVYTYKLRKGISKVKGGMFVLKELGYPEELLIIAKHTLSKQFV